MQLLHKACLTAAESCAGFLAPSGHTRSGSSLHVLFLPGPCLRHATMFGHVLCSSSSILRMLDRDPAIAGNHVCRILGILLTVA